MVAEPHCCACRQVQSGRAIDCSHRPQSGLQRHQMSPQCIRPDQGCRRCEHSGCLDMFGPTADLSFPTHEEAAQNLSCRSCCTLCQQQRWQTLAHHAGRPLCDPISPGVQAPALGQGPLSGHVLHRGPSARTLVAAAELPPSRTVNATAPPATLSLPSDCTPCTPTGTLPGFAAVGLQSLTAAVSHTKTATQTWRMPLCCRHLWLQAHAALLQLHQHVGASNLHSRHCW